MAQEDKDYSFKSLKHQTLADLVKNPVKIGVEAAAAGQTGDLIPPAQPKPEKKQQAPVKKKENPTTVANGKSFRGRVFLFKPTSERVTVIRENVGNAYDGDWIHEVISRDGKMFLVSMKQLADTV
jgi:hypothetical protein